MILAIDVSLGTLTSPAYVMDDNGVVIYNTSIPVNPQCTEIINICQSYPEITEIHISGNKQYNTKIKKDLLEHNINNYCYCSNIKIDLI
jgi:hypothetical protein